MIDEGIEMIGGVYLLRMEFALEEKPIRLRMPRAVSP